MVLKIRPFRVTQLLVMLFFAGLMPAPTSYAQDQSQLTVEQIMKEIIAPMTAKIWGAYEIKTNEEWLELEHAAVAVLDAGTLLKSSGADAQHQDWQDFNEEMVVAAQAAIMAIKNKNEEALFNAGNDQLYPPCESCHQKYMSK